MFIQTYWLSLAVLLTGTLAQAQSLPDPSCFQDNASGTATRGAGACAQFINTFCANVASMNPPSSMRVGDNAGRCFNLDANRRCDFVALNTFSQNAPPSETNCRNVLNNVVGKCTKDLGGSGQVGVGAYTFSIDPNTGLCPFGVQAGN